jgi:hypothetical protein
MTARQRRLRIFGFFVLGVLMFALSVVLAYDANCYPETIVTGPSTYGAFCTGITALVFRDLINHHLGIIPYVNYPFEYYTLSGVLQYLVNLVFVLSGNNNLAAIYFSNSLMAVFAIAILPLYYKLGISLKKVAVFYVLTPASIMYGLSFDYLQALLLILSYYYFTKKQEKTSALFLGLTAGIKLYPILFLLPFLRYTSKKLRFVVITVSTFVTGIGIQYFLNPANFMRAASYLASYSIEGSWIGYIFPQYVLHYGDENAYVFYNIPLHFAIQPYQVVSGGFLIIALVISTLLGKFELEERLLMVYSSVFIFIWISTPQMVFGILALIPLIKRIKITVPTLLTFYPVVIFTANIFLIGYTPIGFHSFLNLPSPLFIQALAELFLLLFIIGVFLPRGHSVKSSIGESST